jgi:hypothetical protein
MPMDKDQIENEDVEGHSHLLRGEEAPLESTASEDEDVEGHSHLV